MLVLMNSTASITDLNKAYADAKREFATASRRGTEGERAVARMSYQAAGDVLDHAVAASSELPSFFIRGVA
jgi:mannose/cellobiose epimerase-like protein (N-acyl-D-glucosamine 2-epimerase family)